MLEHVSDSCQISQTYYGHLVDFDKHELDSSFPAFLFCHVDYSPTRKAPLKRGIRVGSSREAVD